MSDDKATTHRWACPHLWLESSQYVAWIGGSTDTPMPPEVTWTVVEFCQICGETRERVIPPNNSITGGEAVP